MKTLRRLLIKHLKPTIILLIPIDGDFRISFAGRILTNDIDLNDNLKNSFKEFELILSTLIGINHEFVFKKVSISYRVHNVANLKIFLKIEKRKNRIKYNCRVEGRALRPLLKKILKDLFKHVSCIFAFRN